MPCTRTGIPLRSIPAGDGHVWHLQLQIIYFVREDSLAEIEKRDLGNSGLKVPALGLGTMTWGEKRLGYDKTFSFGDIFQVYQTCLDAGFNFFDTAAIYGKGESERLLGECYRRDGRQIIIATKVAPNSMLTPSIKRVCPHTTLKELDRSLERLGVDCIGLYQLHMPPAKAKLDIYMDLLAKAVQAGKIRAIGVCNFTAPLIQQAHTRLANHGLPLASAMVGYNLLRRNPEKNGVLDTCRELNIALVAYAPLAEGILTGKYRSGTEKIPLSYKLLLYLEQLNLLKETKHPLPILRRLFGKPRNTDFKRLEPLFVQMETIANTHQKTIAQVAMNWLLSQDAHIIAIPGVKNLRQVKENIGTLGWQLTGEECALISQAEVSTL
jgi:aryl-alcohol dehydrogenase-like predicted oxidoreductase